MVGAVMFQNRYDLAARDGNSVTELHRIIRSDADDLAGGLDDLGVRARVYHQIYRDAQARFHFPLIASHGALWATWYLRTGRLAAEFFALSDVSCQLSRQRKISAFRTYIDAIKEINRQVMIETFTCFYLFRVFGHSGCEELGFDSALTDHFQARLAPETTGSDFTPEDDRIFYEAFFRWEQQKVVGPKLDDALADFDWPFMRNLCQQPWVWFSYFRLGRALIFRSFSDAEERVEKGLIAFDWAVRKGWPAIERNCRYNPFLSGEERVAVSDMADGLKSEPTSLKIPYRA